MAIQFCSSKMDYRATLAITAVLAALFNLFPLMLLTGGGDLPLQYALIECYGRQFWQGDFYPRWCMNANVGYGSPIPIFYNLLPYYVTSVIYPAVWFGASIPSLYLVGVFLAAFTTFIGAVFWLRSITGNLTVTMAVAWIFLWLPYRMELLGTRAAYSELWSLALLPFLFYYARMLATNTHNAWPQFSAVLAMCLLCHPITSLMGLIASGMYILFFNPPLRNWLASAGAVLLAFLVAAFHWYPASALFSYTGESAQGNMRSGWANYFADSYSYDPVHFLWGVFEPISWLRLWHVSVMVIAILLGVWLSRSALLTNDRQLKREVIMWCSIALLSCFLYFSISAPLWELIQTFTKAMAPWRAAMLGIFALVVMITIALNYHYRRLKLIILCIASMIAGTAMIQVPKVENPEVRELMEMSGYIIPYYNTFQTISKEYVDEDKHFYKRFAFNRAHENASLSQGTATINQWNSRNISITTHSPIADTLYLEQFYFPTWQAEINGTSALLSASADGTGRMTLDLPAGDNVVTITHQPSHLLSAIYRWICLLSATSAFVILAGLLYMRRRYV